MIYRVSTVHDGFSTRWYCGTPCGLASSKKRSRPHNNDTSNGKYEEDLVYREIYYDSLHKLYYAARRIAIVLMSVGAPGDAAYSAVGATVGAAPPRYAEFTV